MARALKKVPKGKPARDAAGLIRAIRDAGHTAGGSPGEGPPPTPAIAPGSTFKPPPVPPGTAPNTMPGEKKKKLPKNFRLPPLPLPHYVRPAGTSQKKRSAV